MLAIKGFFVRPDFNNTWQCYHCNNFGHNASECRYKVRCLLCGGEHKHTVCPKKGQDGKVSQLKCSNCSGNHAANYGGCPSIKMAKLAEKIRVEEKISYREALLKSKNMANRTVPDPGAPSNTVQSGPSAFTANYNFNSDSPNPPQAACTYVDSSTSTDQLNSNSVIEFRLDMPLKVILIWGSY